MTVMIKLRKGTIQHIESELYAYHDTKKEIIRLKNEILHGTGRRSDDNAGGGRGNLPGDPTAQAAVLLISHRKIEQLERIVDAIEHVVERLPAEKKKVVQLRYWDRSKALTWDGIASAIPAHRATVIRWRDEIVYAIAEKIGWR